MRISVLIFVTFVGTSVKCLFNQRTAIIIRNEERCVDETKLDRSVYDQMKSGDWTIFGEHLHDWALCFLRRSGIMNSNGVFKMDKALYRTPKHGKEVVDELIEQCLSPVARPPAEIAWRFYSCYKSSSPTRYKNIIF